MKFITRFSAYSTLLAGCLLLPGFSSAQSKLDKDAIKVVIEKLVKGVDEQDGDLLLEAFHPKCGLFAFTPDGKDMLTVTVDQFAGLHSSGKFGGRKRKMEIRSLDVNDGLIASAVVHAYDKEVFYDYRLTFFKLDGKWGIVSFGQRSKKNG